MNTSAPSAYKRYFTATAAKMWLSRKKQDYLLERAAASRRVRAVADAYFLTQLIKRVDSPLEADKLADVYYNSSGAAEVSSLANAEGILSDSAVKRIMLDSYREVVECPAKDTALASKEALGRVAMRVAGIAQEVVKSSVPGSTKWPAPYPFVVPFHDFTLEKTHEPDKEPTHAIKFNDGTLIQVKLTKEIINEIESGDAELREVVFTWKRANGHMFERARRRNAEEKKFAPYFTSNGYYLVIQLRLSDTKEYAQRNGVVANPMPVIVTTPSGNAVTTQQVVRPVSNEERIHWRKSLASANVCRYTELGDRWIVSSKMHSKREEAAYGFKSGSDLYHDVVWSANAYAHGSAERYQHDHTVKRVVRLLSGC